MKVIQKPADEGMVRLEATATVDEVAQALHIAQIAFANTMGLQFEQGKTVAQVAKEKLGIENLDSVVENDAVRALVPFALEAKSIIALYLPEPEVTMPIKRGREFSFALEVLPKPSYELSSYEPLEFSAPAFVANDELVEQRLKEMTETYVTYETAEAKPIETGDSCLIAMECFEDGKRMDSLSTEGRTYVTGKGYMPEGFDEGIYGMLPGETRTFSFDGPDFDEDFNPIMKKVDCTVTVKEIQQEVTPELDDAWVKDHMPWYGSFEELRADIARSFEAQQRAQYDGYLRDLALKELVKRFEGKIADEAYEATRTNLVSDIRMSLQQQGKSWEDFVKENGGEQQFGMMLMLQTREVLVQGFVLDAVYRHEKLAITDEDINEAAGAINPNVSPKQVREQFEQTGQSFILRETAERLKANKWIVEHAKINYVG